MRFVSRVINWNLISILFCFPFHFKLFNLILIIIERILLFLSYTYTNKTFSLSPRFFLTKQRNKKAEPQKIRIQLLVFFYFDKIQLIGSKQQTNQIF